MGIEHTVLVSLFEHGIKKWAVAFLQCHRPHSQRGLDAQAGEC